MPSPTPSTSAKPRRAVSRVGTSQAGCDASKEELISTLQETDDWDANGLYPNPIPQSTTQYDEQCSFYVVLEGDGFVPVEGADPFCGEPVS